MITNKIKCPHCNYGGGIEYGTNMPEIKIGYMVMRCSACKKEFKIKTLYECY